VTMQQQDRKPTSSHLRERVVTRAGGEHCEAVIGIKRNEPDKEGITWMRCGKNPVELHHRITRARGGLILDRAGEIDHLMLLCRKHHAVAHDHARAFLNGLLMEGSVIEVDGKPQYRGPDIKLSRRYP
jgi:hypothetical protein